MGPRKPNHRTFRVSTNYFARRLAWHAQLIRAAMTRMAPIQDRQTYPAEHCECHATSATREERPQFTFGWLAAEHHFVIYNQVG